VNFATYKTAIVTWLSTETGLTTQIADEAGGWANKTRIFVRLSRPQRQSRDWVVWEQDTDLDPGVDMIPSVVGCRTVVARIEVQSRNNSGNNCAMFFVDKIQTSLAKPSVKAALYAAGLAYNTTLSTVDLSMIFDEREESRAAIDILFNSVVEETDPQGADSYVAAFEVTATFKKPDDSEIGWTEEIIP
jgi:hypothetical protein